MEMSGFNSSRPSESSHVAQQSRRDKLRVQQTSNLSHPHPHPHQHHHHHHHHHHLLDHSVPNNSPPTQQQQNPDIVHVRNLRSSNMLFDPTLLSPELLNFSINANHAFASSAAHEDLGNESSNNSPPQNYGNWRSTQSLDNWAINYATDLKPGITSPYHGYHHFPSPPPPPPPPPPQIYQNTLQDVVTRGRTQQQEMGTSWTQGYADQLGFDDPSSSWMDRPIGSARHNWSSSTGGAGGEELRCSMRDHTNQQGLSLSLSSNPPASSQELQASSTTTGKSGSYLGSMVKPSKSVHDIVGTSTTPTSNAAAAYNRTAGPLGPFTGYATILKSSKFLKPAQNLLEEFCRVGENSKAFRTCEAASVDRISDGDQVCSASVSVSNDQGTNATQNSVVGNMGRNSSGASSSAFYGSNEMSSEAAASSSSESFRPEYHQKKAKLLYMQEEVCRKYKQYHQQMEMVVSSFESVAGLSSASPYISLALRTVCRHFRCLTGSIKDQLKHIKKALGEDFSASAKIASTSGCNGKSDRTMAKLKYMGLGLQKHKATGGGVDSGFSEPQQHVWRPQRGLPDRAVAILRAWLFDHFLHPYPTDTDKHMLATQTGLTRNQVSNWFINARVRVWKPMVGDLSMEACQDPGKDGNSPTEGSTSRPNNEQQPGTHRVKANRQLESSGIGSLRDVPNVHQNHEIKRSRIECQVPSGMDSALMGFLPYNQSGLEVGGLGAVSLTLGLRHGVESAQQQQQQLHQQEEYQLRRQLGGHIIHDFVG